MADLRGTDADSGGPVVQAPDTSAEDRRRHLEMIQGVVARLATNGNDTKTWAVTLGGTAFGASAFQGMWYLASIGVAAVVSFSVLNTYYLHEERLFRELYKAAARDAVPRFDMNKDAFKRLVPSRLRTYFSWSIIGFFATLTLGGIAATGIGLAAASGEDTRDGPVLCWLDSPPPDAGLGGARDSVDEVRCWHLDIKEGGPFDVAK